MTRACEGRNLAARACVDQSVTPETPLRILVPTLVLAALLGCSDKPAAQLSWDFQPHLTSGEVRVLPVLDLTDGLDVRYDSYVTEHVPRWRVVLRQQRIEEAATVPAEVTRALPGALNAELRDSWDGRFRTGRYPVGSRDRLATSLRSEHRVDDALSDVARRAEGDAVLLTWVEELDTEPLTTLGFPGDLIETVAGPVYVDLVQEHHRVWATVGVALVDHNGEVVMRLTRDVESVISLRVDAPHAARAMAAEIAHDMVLVWPDARRLAPYEVASR